MLVIQWEWKKFGTLCRTMRNWCSTFLWAIIMPKPISRSMYPARLVLHNCGTKADHQGGHMHLYSQDQILTKAAPHLYRPILSYFLHLKWLVDLCIYKGPVYSLKISSVWFQRDQQICREEGRVPAQKWCHTGSFQRSILPNTPISHWQSGG